MASQQWAWVILRRPYPISRGSWLRIRSRRCHRALGLLAHAHARAGHPDRAAALFQQATGISTLSETHHNYASFLVSQGRQSDANVWAQRILDKKPTMPGYLRRLERPWFRKAKALMKP